MRKYTLSKTLALILLLLYFAFAFFPLYWIVAMSFKSPRIAISPNFLFRPTLQNYLYLIGKATQKIAAGGKGAKPEFMYYLLNSLIITTGAVLLTLVAGIPAGYGLAKFKFLGKENIAFTFLSFWFAPILTIIIPFYTLYQHFGLRNTYRGLFFAYQIVTLPLTVWLARSFFEEVPKEISEAALIDGCNWWRQFLYIDLPLIRFGLITTIILIFIFAWNNFPIALFLSTQRTKPLPVGIQDFIEYQEILWGPMAAGITLSILPALIFSFFIQKYLVRGLTFGAVKG